MTTKTKNILTWIISVFVGFVLGLVGIQKLLGAQVQIDKLNGWGFPLWTRFPIGAMELLLGIGILIPGTRKISVYLILAWGVFAVITYVQAGQVLQAGLPLLLALIAGVILLISPKKNP